MTINAADFRRCIVEPALAALAPAGIPKSQVAADLLMATAANETDLGTWLDQDPGPALGVFQIEPASLANLIAACTPAQLAALAAIKTPQPYADQITSNLVLAAAICRLYYWQVPEPLPADVLGAWSATAWSGLWGYYKQFYNTALGAATLDGFVSALKLTDIVFS